MTAQQCAERQAARDNLVHELVEVLKNLLLASHPHSSYEEWLGAVANARVTLARAKGQA